jgi:sensor c-di-GMP phosphodiesterase-like protein
MTLPSAYPLPLLRISSKLGKHALGVGIAFGTALALLVLGTAAWVAMQWNVRAVDAGHQQVLQTMQNLQTDISSLLEKLNAQYPPNCDADNLARMRGLQFSHRNALAIGVLDPQGRLFCTSGAGLLPAPLAQEGKVIDGAIGRYYLSTPTSRFNPWIHESQRSTVVERGRFQVVLDERTTRSVFTQYADAVWAGNAVQRRLIYQKKDKKGQTAESVLPDTTPHMRLDWDRQVLLVSNMAPGASPITVQSAIWPGDLYQQQPLLLTGFLALCLLLGWLGSSVVSHRCRSYLSIDFRVHHLCQAANVVCHYQPIVDLHSRKIVGCEVLARLQDGDTLLYPDQFIPALIRQKLAWRFDALVSQHALQELGSTLPPQKGPFKVALNFFPQNLRCETLHPHLLQAQKQCNRHDLHIHLEVTEYDFSEHLIPEFRQFQSDGYAICIDDFGTGYSNLGVVKHIAPDYLKIDKSFVFEMEDTTIRSSLIPEIIAIAKAIRSEVVAEGIENQAQMQQLRALGVQYGQGYYFSRPVAIARFLALLHEADDASAMA